MESEDEFHDSNKSHVFPSQKKQEMTPKKDLYEIDYDEIDTMHGSEDNHTIQSERFLKMSHISTKKSNSTSSNIQDCQELVNGLENDNSFRHCDNAKRDHIEQHKSENYGIKTAKNDQSLPSWEINSNSQTTQNEITIINNKIMPDQDSSQMQIYEIITNSIEITNKVVLEKQFTLTNCGDKSEETTQITRINSESQQSACSQNDKFSGIDIENTYSFVHDLEHQKDNKMNADIIEYPNLVSSTKIEKDKLKKNFKGSQEIGKNINHNHDFYEANLNSSQRDIEVMNLPKIKKKPTFFNQQIKNEKIVNNENFN